MSSTKFVIVIPDGATDQPVPELDGMTPLEAARIPEMDRVAHEGIIGRSRNVPDCFLACERRGDPQPVRLRPRAVLHRAGPA